MTRFNKIVLLLLLFAIPCKAQNLYDEQHSAKFAEYLFQSQQFDLAAQEYERLLYMNDSADYKLQLFKSYRKSGNLSLAAKRFSDILNDSIHSTSEPIAQEYVHLLMLQQDLPKAANFSNSNKNISELQNRYNLMQISMLSKNWKRADSLASLIKGVDTEYLKVLESARNMKHRYAGLALTFSMIIPGAGKAYSGYWKDGIVSLLFVAATGWQSYRGFDKSGSKSTAGWIWGSISTGFYFGNLYGSFRSAKRYNNRQNEILHQRAESYIYSTF